MKTFRLSFSVFANKIEKHDNKHVASMVVEIESELVKQVIEDVLNNTEKRKYYGSGRFVNMTSLRSKNLTECP